MNNYDVLSITKDTFYTITSIIDKDEVVFVTRTLANKYRRHMESINSRAYQAIAYGDVMLSDLDVLIIDER